MYNANNSENQVSYRKRVMHCKYMAFSISNAASIQCNKIYWGLIWGNYLNALMKAITDIWIVLSKFAFSELYIAAAWHLLWNRCFYFGRYSRAQVSILSHVKYKRFWVKWIICFNFYRPVHPNFDIKYL